MAITVLNQGNVPIGPFTRAQVAEKLQSGEFSPEQLAFAEGLSQWTPLREVLAHVDAAVAPPVVAAPVVASSAGVASYSYAVSMQPPGHLVYAGFWLRFVAFFVDGLIVGIPLAIVGGVIGGAYGFTYVASHPGSKVGFLDTNGDINISYLVMEMGLICLSLLVKWLYFALQESSSAQATLGKRALGLKVTNLEGQRIGFGQASGRFFGKIISGLTLLIGYMMAGFTERKQALHDILAGTLVVRN